MAPINRMLLAAQGIDVLLLLFATPFLLFPDVIPGATALALASVPLIWLLRSPATNTRLLRTPLNTALLVWLLAVLAAATVSADPHLTLPKLCGILLGLSIWRTLVAHVRAPRSHLTATGLFLAVAGALLAVGAAGTNWQSKFPVFENLISALPLALRLPGSGAGVHPNEMAGTILLCWPLSLALLAGTRDCGEKQFPRWILLLAIVVALGGAVLLLLSQSRGGWLGGLAAIAAFVWLRRLPSEAAHRRRWLAAGVIVFAFAGGLLFVAFPWLSREAVAGQSGSLETIGFRLEVWRYALEAIADFPLTGPGLGTFREVVLRLYPITAFPDFDIAHAHNVFLQMALDSGLPGLVAYVALLFLAAAEGWRRLAAVDPLYVVSSAGILATMIGFHVYGLTDTIAPGAKPGLLFWWLLALLTDRTSAS